MRVAAHQSGHIFSLVPPECRAGGRRWWGGGGGEEWGRSAGLVGINGDVSRGLAGPNRSIRGSAETAACQWKRAPESRTRSRAASSNTLQEPPPSISADCDPVGGPRGGGPGAGPLPHKAATGRGHSSRSGRRRTNELVTFTAGRGGGLAPLARSEGETSFSSAFLRTPNSISSRAKMLRPHSFFFFPLHRSPDLASLSTAWEFSWLML